MNDAERLELPHVIPEGEGPFGDELREHGYYDRSGNNISFRDWARLCAWDEKNDLNYKRVGGTTVGPYWISTVWLGLNHQYGTGRPLIFETMVFSKEESDLACHRYATEAEAIAGHERVVEEVSLIYEATKENTP